MAHFVDKIDGVNRPSHYLGNAANRRQGLLTDVLTDTYLENHEGPIACP
jgi:hypothetical protein